MLFVLIRCINKMGVKRIWDGFFIFKDTPKQLLVSHKIKDKKTISDALNTHLIDTPNKDKKHYLNIASLTVKENLNQNLLARFRKKSTLVHLQSILNLKKIPEYIECFDISHMMGERLKPLAWCLKRVFQKLRSIGNIKTLYIFWDFL